MEAIKANCADILELLKTAYGLKDFLNANWNDYYNCMYESLDGKVEWDFIYDDWRKLILM